MVARHRQQRFPGFAETLKKGSYDIMVAPTNRWARFSRTLNSCTACRMQMMQRMLSADLSPPCAGNGTQEVDIRHGAGCEEVDSWHSAVAGRRHRHAVTGTVVCKCFQMPVAHCQMTGTPWTLCGRRVR